MNIIQAIILGIVEGITEFLPVSSTAHLIITSKLLGVTQNDFAKFFEVFIQAGAILAVIFLYFQYVVKHKDVIKSVIFSFIPTAIVGLLLHKVIKDVFFESNGLIIFAMIAVGVVFLLVEYLIRSEKIKLSKNIGEINWQVAVLIGAAQSVAVIPGVSRAGIVMVAMMTMGYKRDESATYSFLLAVPTILAAAGLDLLTSYKSLNGQGTNITLLIVGFVVSFITAYFAVKWLVEYLKKNSLVPFGLYRTALGIALIFFGV